MSHWVSVMGESYRLRPFDRKAKRGGAYTAGMETVTLASGRTYLLARPPTGTPPRSVVVMLHGTGGSAAFAADETRLVPFAAAAGFVVAFGDGLPVNPAEPVRFLTNPRRWNDGSTTPGDPFHADTDDVAYLAELIADVLARADGDRSRVYLTGFSNGAGMAFRFAAERSDQLAAVAPVAGYCPAAVPVPGRPVPTLFILGDVDPLIPLHGGPVRLPWGNRTVVRPPIRDTVERWAARLGGEFPVVAVPGLGHHWPGGKGQFNPRLGGPTSDRLDANREIWAFFRRHRLP